MSKKATKKPAVRKAPPVPAEEGLFVTVGVPRGPRARTELNRAVARLKSAGFLAAITSDDAILLAAERLKQVRAERTTTDDNDERTEQ